MADVTGRPRRGGTGLVGRTYLLHGQPVTVLAGWGAGASVWNVLLQLADGSRVVRPFRGLRRISEGATT